MSASIKPHQSRTTETGIESKHLGTYGRNAGCKATSKQNVLAQSSLKPTGEQMSQIGYYMRAKRFLKRQQRRILIPLILLVSGWFGKSVAAQTYVIDGQIDATYFGWNGEVTSTQTTKFTAMLNGNNWLLRSEFAEDWYWLVGSDGTNAYSVLVDPKAQKLPAPAIIFPGTFPKSGFDRVSVPWLAFCSANFVADPANRTSIPSLWIQAQLDPMAHVCSTTTSSSDQPPGLPVKIDWVTSAKRIAVAASNSWLRAEGASPEEVKRRSIDFDAEVLPDRILGKYEVTEATNINGVVLPLSFQLRGYGYPLRSQREVIQDYLASQPRTNNSDLSRSAETFLLAAYKGRATRISEQNTAVQLPDAGRTMSVTDYRLYSQLDGIDYVTYTADAWRPMVDQELTKLLDLKRRSIVKNSIYTLDPKLSRRTVIRSLVFLALLAPIVAWVMKRIKQTNNTQPKGES